MKNYTELIIVKNGIILKLKEIEDIMIYHLDIIIDSYVC